LHGRVRMRCAHPHERLGGSIEMISVNDASSLLSLLKQSPAAALSLI
jgi:hypothetical protein